ncbi:MAG: VanZ family protein [Proteobacteria bacterium]|nr:VanZ family protein [Pseudomonadota bacterium]
MKAGAINKTVSIGYMPLGYMAMVVLALTLEPFQFRIPGNYHMALRGSLWDIIENVILFMPLGFLYRTGSKRSYSRQGMDALCLGLIFSLGIEVLQYYLPQRFTTFSDILANGTGACLGALLYDRLTRKIDERRLVKVLSLDLPLSTLMYLLIPLLWLNDLETFQDPARNFLSVLPVMMASMIMSSVYIHRLNEYPGTSVAGVILVSLCFLVLSMMPILKEHPIVVIELGVFMTGLTFYQVMKGKRLPPGEKRFERLVLKKVLPLFGLYLLLLSLWPFSFTTNTFMFSWWGIPSVQARGAPAFYHLFEMTVAFSVLGYISAEARSRMKETQAACLGLVLLFLIFSASGVELLKGFRPGGFCSPMEGLMFTLAGIYGGIMYLRIAQSFLLEKGVMESKATDH